MEKYFESNSFDIFYNLDTMILWAFWHPGSQYLSKNEYIENWVSVLEHTNILSPSFLVLESEYFRYRAFSEVNIIFNEISLKLGAENIVFVSSKSIVERKTIDDLINNCPVKGHKIYNSSDEAIKWLEFDNKVECF